MFPLVLALLVQAVATEFPFEFASNKPFVSVTVDGSGPLWFILDTGNNGNSMLSRECADRLKLDRTADEKARVGAGSGADVRISRLNRSIRIATLGETLVVDEPMTLSLGHIARLEGRRVDGLIGHDFLAKHVVEIDYATSRIRIHDPARYEPPAGATSVPLMLDTGWPIVRGTITPRGGRPIPCDLIIDTGVRGVVTMFRPFSEKHGLYDADGNIRDAVVGGGVGGVSRGDVARVDALALGARVFEKPVAVFSRDTEGIFAADGPDGIVGGEVLKRHRVTFDYPHQRMILEPYPAKQGFEYDMSGLFLAAEDPDFAAIRILSVNPKTPAAEAGLKSGDEIVSIDGRRTPALTLDQARGLLRAPGTRRLAIRRDGKDLSIRLAARRLV